MAARTPEVLTEQNDALLERLKALEERVVELQASDSLFKRKWVDDPPPHWLRERLEGVTNAGASVADMVASRRRSAVADVGVAEARGLRLVDLIRDLRSDPPPSDLARLEQLRALARRVPGWITDPSPWGPYVDPVPWFWGGLLPPGDPATLDRGRLGDLKDLDLVEAVARARGIKPAEVTAAHLRETTLSEILRVLVAGSDPEPLPWSPVRDLAGRVQDMTLDQLEDARIAVELEVEHLEALRGTLARRKAELEGA